MGKTRPTHWPMSQFPVVDDCLWVGGMPLTQLAARIGQTPFYAYERRLLDQKMALLRGALPPAIELHYAVKANPMPAVVQHMAGLVDGLDVASLGELRIALDSGTSPSRISFAGPGKRPVELTAAIAAGITVNLESPGELETLARLGQEQGRQPQVAVRINPDFELKTSGMKMGGGPKPFGVDAEQVPALLRRIGELGLDFQGFHIFTGSQNLRAEAIVEAHDRSFELALRLAAEAPGPLRLLNIGGGFGIPYFPGDRPLDLAPIATNLERWLPVVKARVPQAQVVLELGRYLVGEAGIYVAEVVDRKVSRGHTFLITDGGLHHHLAASGNFGQVIRKNYPVVVGNRVLGAERETVSVVGPLCTPLDILADRMELAKADIGDLIVVFQSGAYGLTASPTAFLGHPPCVEILV
ncbi:pyridoxal-dependent decarboxylase, exosortase A system-associated [Candidatus Competibacter phosphatis]|uniref:Pyridoxal-dependent decarboxylase, exosortase A system-associated n=1 Tax=Candidatus Competibacter phosphatis TaxID=221280 RepID=A0ABX1TLC8_9GAMM|nr:pyridoxal-dependent decarboxylase, exosortase A system-associated [Candidatus Competibacter phosphatis]NMQ20201.1 pyridoxal-dependent decarboxylase, exosortase A system-associated [Candidatus Competibacter phosphatis]